MEPIIGFIILAALVFVIYKINRAIGKGIGFATKKLNQNLLFKNEYQEDINLISTPLLFITGASINDIKLNLNKLIQIQETSSFLTAGFYQSSPDANTILYTYGGKGIGEKFTASLVFSREDNVTTCEFEFINYYENYGLVENREQILFLRKQVKAAFKNADPHVMIKAAQPKPFYKLKDQ